MIGPAGTLNEIKVITSELSRPAARPESQQRPHNTYSTLPSNGRYAFKDPKNKLVSGLHAVTRLPLSNACQWTDS